MIRVLLAEDQSMVRGAIAALLSLEPDIEVVAEVAGGDQVEDAVSSSSPDVAVLDIELPQLDGIAAAARLRTAFPHCRVLMLTTYGRPGYVRRALAAGADGFLLKDAPPAQLADAVRSVARGERVVDPALAVAAMREGDNPLSSREAEALRAVVRGADIAAIATELHLSEGSVRNHLSVASQKLGAHSRVDAARIALELGYL